jgi:hypothetical protein
MRGRERTQEREGENTGEVGREQRKVRREHSRRRERTQAREGGNIGEGGREHRRVRERTQERLGENTGEQTLGQLHSM